jgi:hypothetical protein
MSRLRETNFQGIKGWQWDIGPIFVGERGRENAVNYGKAIQYIEEWEQYAKLCQEQEIAKVRLETLKAKATAINKVEDNTYYFHWLDGGTEVGLGKTVEDAFSRLGYAVGAMRALDYFEEVE